MRAAGTPTLVPTHSSSQPLLLTSVVEELLLLLHPATLAEDGGDDNVWRLRLEGALTGAHAVVQSAWSSVVQSLDVAGTLEKAGMSDTEADGLADEPRDGEVCNECLVMGGVCADCEVDSDDSVCEVDALEESPVSPVQQQ